MKISELIKKLSDIKKEYGDVDVDFLNFTTGGYSGNVQIYADEIEEYGEDEDIPTGEFNCVIKCRNPKAAEIGEVREYDGKFYKCVEAGKKYQCEVCDLHGECVERNESLRLEIGNCEEFERDQEDCDVYFKKVKKQTKKKSKEFDLVDGEKQYKMF